MADELLLGIDMGTGGARASLITPTGQHVATGTAEWATSHPRPGRAEQDPAEWWRCIVAAVRKALEGQDASRVVGVSCDATAATVVFQTKEGQHLRPAILWMDVRSTDQADRLGNTGDPALKYTGGSPVSAEWGTPKIMWVKENEPEVYARTEVITDCPSWLVHKLTGEWTMDICSAACKYFYDDNWGGWPTTLYAAAGIPEALDKFPQEIVELGQRVGGLSKQAADELGLPAGIAVGEGGIDAHVGAIGLGVVNPGSIALITGSSHVMLAQTDRALYTPGIWGAYANAIIPGQYTLEAGQASTGSIIAWLRNFLPQSNELAAKEDVNLFQILERGAEQLPPGSDGLIVLDHFQGNRSPHVDPLSRGVIAGLTLGTTEAQLYRAACEGVCYGTAAIFDTIAERGLPMTEIRAAGGPTRSKFWMQMHADVTGLPIVFTKFTEGPLMGSAMLAGVGAGLFPDIQAASDAMVSTDRVLQPNAEAHKEYSFFKTQYNDLYESMKHVLQATSRHVGS